MSNPVKIILGALRVIEDNHDDMHADIMLTELEREIMAIRRRRRMTSGFIAQENAHKLAYRTLRDIEDLTHMPVDQATKHAALMDVHQAVHAEIDRDRKSVV